MSLLVFLAHNISGVTVSHGLASDTLVTVVPTAATNLTGTNRTIALAGDWWDLSYQDVEMKTLLEDGTVVGTKRLFGSEVTGQRGYVLMIDEAAKDADAVVGGVRVVFEKKKKKKKKSSSI